jgi:alpha-N-arabinofuranosidase
VADDDLTAVNTADRPDRVVPQESKDATVAGGTLQATFPPVSWTANRLTAA